MNKLKMILFIVALVLLIPLPALSQTDSRTIHFKDGTQKTFAIYEISDVADEENNSVPVILNYPIPAGTFTMGGKDAYQKG